MPTLPFLGNFHQLELRDGIQKTIMIVYFISKNSNSSILQLEAHLRNLQKLSEMYRDEPFFIIWAGNLKTKFKNFNV